VQDACMRAYDRLELVGYVELVRIEEEQDQVRTLREPTAYLPVTFVVAAVFTIVNSAPIGNPPEIEVAGGNSSATN
jgi:hypothetical protein